MPQLAVVGIVRVDDGADAVLQLRNHLAAAIVGGRVGRKQNQHVQVESHRIPADLHVALLQDIEQADLHQFVQFGQFVHGKDAAMHARDQPEMERFLGRHAGAAGQLGRVDFADQVGELGAGREAFGIPIVAPPPGDRNIVLRLFGHQPLAGRRDGPIGIFVDRNPGDIEVGNFFVQKSCQQPHQAALGLSFFAQEQHVVLRDQADRDLGDHGFVVANDPWKQLLSVRQHANEIVVYLLLDTFATPSHSRAVRAAWQGEYLW